jgi:hypothetical protein
MRVSAAVFTATVTLTLVEAASAQFSQDQLCVVECRIVTKSADAKTRSSLPRGLLFPMAGSRGQRRHSDADRAQCPSQAG